MAIVDDTLRIAQAMPDYDIERELGRGGMGIVFLGRHRRLQRGAAIKELPPSFAAEPEVQERFATEAQTLAGLEHPHIVPIFDYVERDGLCLIVMQELPGGSVWDRFTTEGLTPPTACAVVMACCAALQHAHDKGVLHLDVKPDNLMFDAASAVKVTDFGIARVITGARTMGTVDGQVLGTPAYMSPEQARGEDLSAASDVYAAGAMLYELLSGQLPWQGATTAAELLAQRLEEDPIPIRDVNPAIPEPLAAVTMKALEREVEDRYGRAEDFGIAIGQACADSWGPGWLDYSGVAIIGSDRLSMAARTTGGHVQVAAGDTAAAPGPGTVDPPGSRVTGGGAVPEGAGATGHAGGVAPAPATGAVPAAREAPEGAAETTARAPSTPNVPAPATGAAPPPAPATGAVAPAGARAAEATGAAPPGAVRPPGSDAGTGAGREEPLEFDVVKADDAEIRIRGADLYDLELADLIGVQDVLDPPPTPWKAVLTAALLFATMLLVVLTGIGDVDRDGTLAPGQVSIGGIDVASGARIPLDLAEPVVVAVADDELAARADEVELGFSYLDREVGAASGPLRGGRAVVDPGLLERTVGGHTTATVRVLERDVTIADQDVPVDATQTWFLTAPFVLGALVGLLAQANLETSLKPLRSGRPRTRSLIGAVIWCAVGGIGILMMASSLGYAEPTVTQVVVVALIGAVGGVATVRARIGIARRQRVRKAVKRAQRRLDADEPPLVGAGRPG